MTPGRKFSTRTSACRERASGRPRAPRRVFRFRVTDFLFAFWARKLVPISSLFSFGTFPSFRARSPSVGFSILITSAPRRARWSVAKGPERTFVRSRTRTPSRSLLRHAVPRAGAAAAGPARSCGRAPASRGRRRPRRRGRRPIRAARSTSRAEIHPLEGVDEVFGRDVPGRDLRERAAAEPGEGGLERRDAPAREGGEDVRHPDPVGVVEVAGRLDPGREGEETASRGGSPAPGARARPCRRG